MTNMQEKKDIKSLTLAELQEALKQFSEPAYRAKQLYEWMHGKLAADYEEMTNLPKAFREKCSRKDIGIESGRNEEVPVCAFRR